MVGTSTHYTRATTFAILTISLIVIGALLAGLLYWLLSAAAAAAGDRQQYLLRLASLTMASLLLWLLISMGIVIRYVAQRFGRSGDRHKPMGYVDAWAEAGRRLKPEDAPPIEGFEDDAPDSAPPRR